MTSVNYVLATDGSLVAYRARESIEKIKDIIYYATMEAYPKYPALVITLLTERDRVNKELEDQFMKVLEELSKGTVFKDQIEQIWDKLVKRNMIPYYDNIRKIVESLLKGELRLKKVHKKEEFNDLLRELYYKRVSCSILWVVFPLNSEFEEYWKRHRRKLKGRGIGDIANDIAYLLAYNDILSEFRVSVRRMVYITDKRAVEEIGELIRRGGLDLVLKPEIRSLGRFLALAIAR